MRHSWNGLRLTVQFFSSFPVRKELPMEKRDVTAMYAALPVLGAAFGGITILAVWLLSAFTEVSTLFTGFAVVLLGAVLTGGLHLDGAADTGDAYFSYRDRTRRLEIMEDPRIGAFGTMVLLFLIIGKIMAAAEALDPAAFAAIASIPVFSRIGLLLLFSTTDSAKKAGLAAFFQKQTDRKTVLASAGVSLVLFTVLLALWGGWLIAAVFAGALLLSAAVFRIWCIREFGGVTGDLFGAYIEGTELLLWTALLLFV